MSDTLIPTVFTNPLFGDVRIVQVNDEPWFVATDIARVLDHGEAAKLTRNIKKEYRGLQIVETLGGAQQMSLINASGLFQAVMSSRKPQAEQFQKWVLGDVLPGIARAGRYEDDQGAMGQHLHAATGGALALASKAPTAPARPAPSRSSLGGRPLSVTREAERIVLELFAQGGYSKRELGKAAGVSASTAHLLTLGRYQFSPQAGSSQVSDALIAAVAQRHLLNEQERLIAEQQRIANSYRCTANNQRLAQVLDEVGRHLQQRPALAVRELS